MRGARSATTAGWIRKGIATGGLALGVLTPRAASARDTRVEWQGALDGYGTYVRGLPALGVPDDIAANRTIRGSLPPIGHLTLAGASGDVSFVANDTWVFPLFGLGFATAVGSSPRIVGSIDGSIAEVRPWTTYMGDVLLPGFGVRIKEHRWMFAANVRFGLSFVGVNGSVASGADSTQFHTTDLSFLLRAQLEGCRRLDPSERICLVVSPSIYQFGFGNALSVGLRWEFGP